MLTGASTWMRQEGRRFRALTVVDNWSRHSQLIEVDFTLTGTKVVMALERITKRSGYPHMITVDNGSEFASKALDAWAYAHGVKLDFIRPGKPVENAVIESFNGRFRDECLNTHVFVSLHDARQKIEAWRIDYNEHRPHTSLRMRTPAAFAAARPFVRRQRPPARELGGSSSPEAVAALTPAMLSPAHGFP